MVDKLLGLLTSIALLFAFWIPATAQWTTPVPITVGSQDDIHPATVSVDPPWNDPVEWLAFVRTNGSGSKICIKRTNVGASSWEDSVYSITDDFTLNDYPRIAKARGRLMLVWQRGQSNSDILYSYNFGNGWSLPLALTSDGAGNRSPHVASSDSNFIAVWERGGRILFSKFQSGSWTPPVFITATGDTSNSFPQVQNYTGTTAPPIVVWEKTKPISTSHAILYSLYRDSGWSSPDTVAWAGDNRRPKSLKLDMNNLVGVTYESNRTGDWEVFGAYGFFMFDNLEWEDQAINLSQNPLMDDVDGSFTSFGIITDSISSRANWMQLFTAGTWREVSGTSDSIFASAWYGPANYLSGGAGSVDRNPDLTGGVIAGGGLRVWTVWESNATGHWNLYGSRTDIVLSVDDHGSHALLIQLEQNYPNPFNPSTTIRYRLSQALLVTLTVYDVLGQQVAVLVTQRQQTGDHSVEFRGEGLSSGVYFYRLTAGDVVQTRKFLLVR